MHVDRRPRGSALERRTRSALSVISLLWLGQLGCSDTTLAGAREAGQDEPDAAPADAPLELTPSEELFVEELCRKAQPCCAAAGLASATAACHAKFDQLRASSYYDAARARACLLQLRATALDVTGCPTGPLLPFCSDVFYARGGQKAPGDACAWNAGECAAAPGQRAACGSSNDQELSAKLARCHLLAPSAQGEACDASAFDNADGTTSLSVTQAFEDPESVFLDGRYCDAADGLRCHEQTDVCVRLAEPAAPLAPGEFCSLADPSPCEADAYCAPTSQRCEAKGELGAPCLPFAPQGCRSTFCSNEGRCAPAFGGLKLELVCGRPATPP